MKILIDECVDWRLKLEFSQYDAKAVQDMGWLGKENGELLRLAVTENFDVFITIDKKLRDQINLKNYSLSIIVLDTYRSTLANLKPLVPKIIALFEEVTPGNLYEIRE